MNRSAILIELNPGYAEIARKRLAHEPIVKSEPENTGMADLFEAGS